jgi:hypothetical protein
MVGCAVSARPTASIWCSPVGRTRQGPVASSEAGGSGEYHPAVDRHRSPRIWSPVWRRSRTEALTGPETPIYSCGIRPTQFDVLSREGSVQW